MLLSFLPRDWRELAQDTGALKGLRKDKAVDSLLRTLLLHLGCGHSLRETVVRARQAHLADLSDVALMKRLKKSKGWLHALCVRLFEEQGLAVVPGGAFQVRAVDATTVKEPGPSGSLWRLHYSVGLPSLTCDFFKLTKTEGPGTGESLAQFPIRVGDHVLADRGYSTARGIGHVADAGGRLIVRVNTGSLPLYTLYEALFSRLLARCRQRAPRHGFRFKNTLYAIGPPRRAGDPSSTGTARWHGPVAARSGGVDDSNCSPGTAATGSSKSTITSATPPSRKTPVSPAPASRPSSCTVPASTASPPPPATSPSSAKRHSTRSCNPESHPRRSVATSPDPSVSPRPASRGCSGPTGCDKPAPTRVGLPEHCALRLPRSRGRVNAWDSHHDTSSDETSFRVSHRQ